MKKIIEVQNVSCGKILSNHVEWEDVVNGIAQNNDSMNIGELVHGHVSERNTEAWKLFRDEIVKHLENKIEEGEARMEHA